MASLGACLELCSLVSDEQCDAVNFYPQTESGESDGECTFLVIAGREDIEMGTVVGIDSARRRG